jgi:hypothetical protein
VVLQDKGFGFGLGAGVSIERIGRWRHGLVGSVVVAAFVNAEGADMNKSLDACLSRGVEQQAKRLDVQSPEFGKASPVPHLGGAVEYPVRARDAGLECCGVFEVAHHRLHAPPIEPASVTRGTDQSPDSMPAFQGFFGGVAADQSGGTGDKDRFHRLRVHVIAHLCEQRSIHLKRPWYRIGSKAR